jgi:hypothetical protein
MRAGLEQARARDPAGRFDTAQGFGNAIKNSVATLGGPATPADLARILFTDFADEMASRDEILKAADDPNAAPVSITTKPATPPPVPPRAAQVATSGEMHRATPAPPRRMPTGSLDAGGVPSMIVAQSGSLTGKVSLPDLANVLDLSENVGGDEWMAEGGTDLLKASRMKSLRNAIIGIVLLAGLGVGAYFLFGRNSGEPEEPKVVTPVQIDAGTGKTNEVPIDAPSMSRDDIVAISKFGFFSVDANKPTTIYVDNQRLGETPMKRLPLTPGPHKVKISLVNANHEVFPGQSKTVTFTIPKGASRSH